MMVKPMADETHGAAPARATLGRYRLVRLLGRGGMGEVWEAHDPDLGRAVALKRIRVTTPEDLARFRREAQTAASLSHPSICAIYEVGADGDDHYIAMQLIDGQTLEEAPRPEPRRAAELIRDAARAVAHAHAAGIVHRDLKPGNLMIDAQGRLFVTDFGLARTTKAGTSLSMTGDVVGTPGYMSPQQARGLKVDARADVWGLGATLYALLSGGPPFEGKDVYETLMQVIEREPPPPGGDRDLRTIVMKCLEKEEGRRYAGAGELAEDLQRWLAGEPILARPASWGYRLRKRLMRRRAVAAVALAGLVAVVAVAAIFVPPWLAQRRRNEQLDRARPYLDAGRNSLRDLDRLLATEDWTNEEVEQYVGRARSELAAALREAPDLPEAYLELARSYEMVDDRHTAIQYAGEAIRANPRFATAYLFRAIQTFDHYEGLRHASDGTSVPPTEESRAVLARIEADLDAVARWSSDRRELVYREAMIDFAEARYARAVEKLEEFLKTHPADLEAGYWLGHALIHIQGRQVEAVKPLTRALDLRSRDAAAITMRAIAFKEAGDFARALADLDGVVESNPGDVFARTVRAEVRVLVGDFKGTIEDAEEAVRLNPSSLLAAELLGGAKAELGRIDEALADLNRLIATDPRRSSSWDALGVVHLRAGDLDAALAACDRAVAFDPTSSKALTNRGVVQLHRGEPARAVEDHTRALEQNPRKWEAWINRGNAQQAMRRWKEAESDYDRALELAADPPEAYLGRGSARHVLGKLDEAVADFDRAEALGLREKALFLKRGAIHHLKSRVSKAIADFTEALNLDADYAFAY